MTLAFPEGFFWGTSTAAAQVETASDHNWRGFRSRDGHVFVRTSDHEQRREEDLTYIRQFGQVYRCGVDWARLQKAAYAPFEADVVAEYSQFFARLNEEGMSIMFVIHHFTHPSWLEAQGGWAEEISIGAYVDFARQCIESFGPYVSYWNTFNEPNVYALNGYLMANFPPLRRSYRQANRVLAHMGQAHDIAYELIKERYPSHPVGISFNTCWFDGLNALGKLPAAFMNWWFHRRAADHFAKVDFWGLSYYAYVPFNPLPVTEIDSPGKLRKLGIPHDRMWGYRPEGLGRNLRFFWKRYGKPLIVTENGICTDDPQQRIQSINDYLRVCHEVIEAGIPLLGYIHWSTWDNFEWNLGPTYRFGLVRIDWETKERQMTEAGLYYARICQNNKVEL